MKFKTTYTQFVAPSTTSTLRSGAGELHAVILTCTAAVAELTTLYDNTAGSGNILLSLACSLYHPIVILLPPEQALKFTTGLTVVTAANSRAFAILAY